jgi:hypothetical protein
VLDGLRQRQGAQKVAQIVGEGMQLLANGVVGELPAGQARPSDGVLAFLDVLPGSACLHAREGAALPCRVDCRMQRPAQQGERGSSQ